MSEITFEITPTSRLDIIDINRLVRERHGDLGARFKQALYCSYHTTAGYLSEGILRRLDDRSSIEAYCESFQRIFPPGAGYRHDQLDERLELSLAERAVEPENADSHLTFMGAGLENCVTYTCDISRPAYFIDLDGMNGRTPRRRKTTIVGFNREKRVVTLSLLVPVSSHPIDSVSFRDPRLGLIDQINDAIAHHGIGKGRVVVSLDPSESKAALTVNEYETLLMKHDLVDVLRDPFRFMAEKGKNMLRDPRAIPSKARNYAKYDLVQVLNEIFDQLGMNESIIERVVERLMAFPAQRLLRMKRTVNLLVNGAEGGRPAKVIYGKYQSPILVQWDRPNGTARRVNVAITALE